MDEYKVKLVAFEGPLDLLLHLIENRKLHINDISLAVITDDYMEYLGKLGEFPIRHAAHFILIASTLLLIKSRSLLPTLTLTEEEEEDIESLERRLKIYKKIKALSEYIVSSFGKNTIYFKELSREIVPVFSPTKEISIDSLRETLREVLKRLPKKEMIPQLTIEKILSVEEMVENLSERITKSVQMSFKEFTAGRKEKKIEIIVSFLAMLELVKRGALHVKQDKHFDDIMMRSGDIPHRGGTFPPVAL